MKKRFSIVLTFVLMIVSILQACGLANQQFIQKDTAGIDNLKMVRYETPPMRTYRTGNLIAVVVTSGVLFGGIGAAVGYGIHGFISMEPPNKDIPDFGKMLHDQFAERSKKEIPQWPAMTIAPGTVGDDYKGDKSAYNIEIKVEDIRIEMNSGLIAVSEITMKDRSNEIIWQKGYKYDTSWFGRSKTFTELKANDFKLLKEEYSFAVEKTVSDFISHFNGSLAAGASYASKQQTADGLVSAAGLKSPSNKGDGPLERPGKVE
ncbi:MAG: hypothetical protein PHN75_09560 [Syntrophales bacterium]|nr:hypothetical protein [Syntrophales bacterium]